MTDIQTPTTDEFRPVVLRVLNQGGVHSFNDICEMAADYLNLPQEVRDEKIPSGMYRYTYRINWVCSSLKHAGLIERPQRGHYRITADGLTVDQRSLKTYSEKDLLEWPMWQEHQAEVKKRRLQKSNDVDANTSIEESSDPLEALANGESAFNAQTETNLRKRLQQASPKFFERAVIDLLWAMGYGGAHGEKKHVGRTRDGGIDGIIRQDALGLTNVYIQAKRYADTNKVGEPEIRNFIGSLDSRGANLGVFITTSTFLPRAEQTAANYRHGKIVLIDGIKLTSLMLAYGVAVHKAHEFTLYTIDDDFFEEEELA
ncbi:restriction endonuclease [Corynebacterium sp. HS2168-gen11]|uniref:restriction endonuclease n=1 Tax=Corynebacterium sp. HS2168-gen11 TaxID=2974027 RepID=UPI00216B02ED|nr:restriction endonuclease [Corynebacterium sp. HS2168-gen11]MCS4535495.1 restriction endonuclease [Corynebacterium sp. HS2168-gen11]